MENNLSLILFPERNVDTRIDDNGQLTLITRIDRGNYISYNRWVKKLNSGTLNKITSYNQTNTYFNIKVKGFYLRSLGYTHVVFSQVSNYDKNSETPHLFPVRYSESNNGICTCTCPDFQRGPHEELKNSINSYVEYACKHILAVMSTENRKIIDYIQDHNLWSIIQNNCNRGKNLNFLNDIQSNRRRLISIRRREGVQLNLSQSFGRNSNTRRNGIERRERRSTRRNYIPIHLRRRIRRRTNQN